MDKSAFNLESFQANFNKQYLDNNKHLTQKNKNKVKNVITETINFLNAIHAFEKSYSTEALENPGKPELESITRFEYKSNAMSDLTDDFFNSEVNNFIDRVLPENTSLETRACVAADIYRTLGGRTTGASIYAPAQVNSGENFIPVHSMTGSSHSLYSGNPEQAYRDFSRGMFSNEAYGLSINNTPMDNRLAIITSVLRPTMVLTDRIVRRVVVDQITYTFYVPAQYIYNLARSANDDPNIRNRNNRVLLVDTLIDKSGMLNTTPNPVVPRAENDPTGESVFNKEDGWLLTGKAINIAQLTMDKNRIGYENLNYTDLIAEGGSIEAVLVQMVPANSKNAAIPVNSVSSGEIFKVVLGAYCDASYIQKASGPNSGGNSLEVNAAVTFNAASTQRDGTVSKTLSTFTNANLLLDINVLSSLSLNEGTTRAAGTVEASVVSRDTGLPITDEASPEFKFLSQYNFHVIAYKPKLYWNEDNLRRTTTAIQVTSSEQKFVVPAGRNTIVDQALAQPIEEITIKTITTSMDIGNSARGLQTLTSRWSDVNEITDQSDANSLFNRALESSRLCIAANIVRPKVVRVGIDFADSQFKIAYREESKRLADIQAYVNQVILEQLNIVNCYSGYQKELDPGEPVVFKAIVHSRIADMLMGIKNYVPVWNDPDRLDNDGNADIVIPLTNGTRIEVIKTLYTEYTNSILIIPTRQNGGADDILSAGFTIDCGKYITDFRGYTSGDSVSRRCVANSREIIATTNVIGVIIDIKNLDQVFTKSSSLNSIADDINKATNKTESDNTNTPDSSGNGTEESGDGKSINP